MNYHLNKDGHDMGVFSLEELQRRRDAGGLTGKELVWTEGMKNWQTLNSVLTPPQLSGAPPPRPRQALTVVTVAVIVAATLFLAGTAGCVFLIYKVFHSRSSLKQLLVGNASGNLSAMSAANRPVTSTPDTPTWVNAQQAAREFRMRQYVEGYQLRGERNPGCDRLAQQFLTNWIACNYGGTVDTNLPSLTELGNQLAGDPDCQDPLVLTVAAVNAVELHEAIRRLERAVKGFENSRHRGYPKFFATTMLASKLIQDQTDRLPVLDAAALEDLKAALADGSIRPEDQAQIAEVLVNDWGNDFFRRNEAAVVAVAQNQGKAYQWLALVLEGEQNINEAWRARGDGYAGTVTDTGWSGFRQHLAVARKSLSQAWKLRPDLPLAPCRMMTVSLGDSDITEMRKWLDRTTAAQIDYSEAWKELRWGLRPRWYGDTDSMLAFGVTALKTRRFDTQVPHGFFDTVSDLEAEADLEPGEHLYAREDIWPRLQEMYEGYIAEPSIKAYDRDGWRSTYTVIAYLAGKYDVAQQQLQALNWQPHAWNLTGWNRDLSLMPQEVAARTGAQSADVNRAETLRETGDLAGAFHIYQELSSGNQLDAQTGRFVQDRLVTLAMEQRLQAGDWVDFLPTDAQFTGWQVGLGNFKYLPDGALEVQSDENGHLIYCRARLGTEFEVRGQFEVVSTSTKAFQAGLVMGVPQMETYNWYGFRIKRNRDEGDVTSFSQHWLKRQILAPVSLDSHVNAFDFSFHGGKVSATVAGRNVFDHVAPPENSYVSTNEFVLGLGAFNDSNTTTIRYRKVQVRKLTAP